MPAILSGPQCVQNEWIRRWQHQHMDNIQFFKIHTNLDIANKNGRKLSNVRNNIECIAWLKAVQH